LALLLHQIKPQQIDSEKAEKIYYDTCLFAIELEQAAIDYLQTVVATGGQRAELAEMLIEEHKTSLASLWGRISVKDSAVQESAEDADSDDGDITIGGPQRTYESQYEKARQYADEVYENALAIELEQIRQLREEGSISEHIARELREDVYLLQMQLQEG